jgi:hypothetical protein
MAVRRALRDRFVRDDAAAPGAALDHERLAKTFRQLLAPSPVR